MVFFLKFNISASSHGLEKIKRFTSKGLKHSISQRLLINKTDLNSLHDKTHIRLALRMTVQVY